MTMEGTLLGPSGKTVSSETTKEKTIYFIDKNGNVIDTEEQNLRWQKNGFILTIPVKQYYR